MPLVSGQRQLHASTSLSVLYDSNFARSSQAQADLRGIEPKEVTLRPQLDFEAVEPLGRQIVFLNGNVGYVFHKENSQLDRGRGTVNGGYTTSLGFCSLAGTGSYSAAQADLAELDTRVTKNLLAVSTVALSTQCGRQTGFGGGAQISRQESQNSAKIQRTADSTVESLSLQAGYSNPTLGQLGLVFGYTNSELPNRIIPGRPVGDGFYTQTYGASFGKRFGTRIDVSGQVGRTMVKREFAPPGTDQKFSSTTYAAAASYRFGGRLVLELAGSRAVLPTARAGKLYDIATSGRAAVTYNLGSRYAVSVTENVADVKSNADTTVTTPVITKSRTYSTSASVSYRQSARATLLLDVRYDDRNTNLPAFDYTSTQVGLTAKIGF
jgi:hypothetical protein